MASTAFATTTAYRDQLGITAYRDPLERARADLAELGESLSRSFPRAEARSKVIGQRAARVAFGAVGALGMVIVAVACLANSQIYVYPDRIDVTAILLGSWLAAISAYAVVRVVAAVAIRPRSPRASGVIFSDIEAFAGEEARRKDGRFLARSSLALPAIAVSLLAPLTLHFLYQLVTKAEFPTTRSFGDWISTSLLIVGHAHVVLAVLAGRFGAKLGRMTKEQVESERALGFGALGWTALTAAVPGVVLIAIPPALVAVTGVAFVPILWRTLRYVAARERTAFERLGIEVG